MPIINHVVEYEPPSSFRVESVRGIFDVSKKSITRNWSVEVPDLKEDWKIGCIVGPSGSGKSQIAAKAFGKNNLENSPSWGSGPIVDYFPKEMSPKEICDLLSRVGLGSVPSWLLPYNALSNGQKFRADMARKIAEKNEVSVVDEFSSVVDRVVAKTTSAVISKAIKNTNQKFVAVTCHYDVIEWLEPDWVLDMASEKLARGCLWRRPKINLEIYGCDRSAWNIFKAHHYLSAELPTGADCYAATVDGKNCGFAATIKYPSVQHGMVIRFSRVVVLPDFQGLGISGHMLKAVAEKYEQEVYISTTHGPFAKSLAKSKNWVCCRRRGFVSGSGKNAKVSKGHRVLSLSAGFKYKKNS
jgi:ABC-type lipoprotein export system ATPase subunit/GNAT superfamily N-acetyltransferase